ncbi:MAG: COX15/CtaA family protein [Chloroflexota bacterium]
MKREVAVSTTPRLSNLALLALVSAILLVLIGSIVRVTGYGLGCPDWPLCYGQVIPPLQIGAWVEFSHRFLGGLVSLLVVLVAVLAWRQQRADKWIVRPAVAAVAVLVVQVGLGGLHVLSELPGWTGLIHTGVAMALVGLLAVVAVTSRPPGSVDRPPLGRLPQWAMWAAGATYLLLLTGSLVTRTGASLACPAFPLCGLDTMPDFLRPLVTIQMAHRIIATLVGLLVLAVVARLWPAGRQWPNLRLAAFGLTFLLVAQFTLGISNVLLRLPMWSRSLHLVTGASLWALLVVVATAMNVRQSARLPV